MPHPDSLRDSTEIVLPVGVLDGIQSDLESEFAVTLFESGNGNVRIIGSPVEIKDASEFLTRRGVSVP